MKNELPQNWIKCFLGDVALVEAGNPAPQGNDYFSIQGPLFVRVHDMGKLNGQKYIRHTKDVLSDKAPASLKKFTKGTVLFTKSGASTLLNQRAILAQDSYVVSHIGTATPSDAVLSEWLYYYLTTVDFAEYAHGANMPSMPLSKAKEIETPIPPLNEQKRIVAKIEELFSELDKGIESLKTAREQLKVYRQAVLKHAFEGKLTADWREKNKDKLETAKQLLAGIPTHRRKNLDDVTEEESANIPELPMGWQYSRLGFFIDGICAGKSFKCDEREPFQDEIGVAKVSAVTWGEYNEHESKTCLDSDKVHPEYFIKSGDFLFSRANTIELVGACVIAKTVTKSIMLSDKTLRINFGDLNPYYFLYYLRSQMGRNEIMERSTGNQESMRNIGQDRIRNIILPVCSPLESTKIVQEIQEKFSIIENMEAMIDVELQKSEALRQSILKKSFSGELVAQDPNDEPANVLLARIRAEKNNQMNVKKRVRK
ncbi:MAG TPA: restriction endonuclease subunit S [Alphaproteobacteria bacterium]|nr:restriction endonuclease subunit S [Alphaproteobacteria bacterium]